MHVPNCSIPATRMQQTVPFFHSNKRSQTQFLYLQICVLKVCKTIHCPKPRIEILRFATIYIHDGNSKKIKSRVCVLGLFFHHLMSSRKKQMGLFGKLLVCELQVSSSTAKDPSCGRKFPSLEEPTELNGTKKSTKSAGNHERFHLNPRVYTIHIHVYIYIPHAGQGFHAWIVRRTEGIWVLSAMF